MTATASRGTLEAAADVRAVPTVPLLISGVWIESQSQQWRNVVDPSTGALLARVPTATAEELGAAVDAARDAWPGWRRTPPAERAALFGRARERIAVARPELVGLLVAERGKTRAEAGDELLRTLEALSLAARIAAVEMAGQTCEIAAGVETRSRLEPLGVCAGITPFDEPALLPVAMAAVSLAAGNSFVLKPSRQVPLTTLRLVELLHEAGLPPGVLNVVHGGEVIVNGLCDHPDIAALAFAGSAAVASRVQQRAQLAGKRVHCDPGRHNHAIVLPDASRRPTVERLIDDVFGSAGQRSTAIATVALVGAARDWLPDLVAAAATRRVGVAADAGTEIGPLISAAARRRIEQLIADAVAGGAALALDGRGIEVPGGAGGHFLGPTVVTGSRRGQRIDRESIHGPLLRVLEAPTLDAAVGAIQTRADSAGTGVCLHTGSREAARRFAATIEAGSIAINAPLAAAVPLPRDEPLPMARELPPCLRATLAFCTRAGATTERWDD